MDIEIIRPNVVMKIGKQKLDMSHADLEVLFEKLRVYLGKGYYYPTHPSYPYITCGGTTTTFTGSDNITLTTTDTK